MICPSLVTTPSRSPSPSKARPSSASVSRSARIRSSRFSGCAGSGWWFGKVPSMSVKSSTTSQPSARNNATAVGPATPLPQSIAIFIGRASFTVVRMRSRYAGSTSAMRSAPGALPRISVALLDASAQRLDRVAVQRRAGQHHLQAVVLGRVVAAGDLHAGAGIQVHRGEVQHRRRHHADIDDVRAGRGDARDQRVAQQGAGQPTVAADTDRRQLPVDRLGAKRRADQAHSVRRQGRVDDAADVVGLEERGGNLGGGHWKPVA